jgi:capsular polysaccharide biosynthesis protein
LAKAARETEREDGPEQGFDLADALGFLRANLLLIGILTLVFAALVVAVALLLPQRYSKQLTLEVQQVPTGPLEELNQPILSDAQVGQLAVSALRDAGIEGVSVSPNLDPVTEQVNVAVQSGSRNALEGIAARLASVVKRNLIAAYKDPLGTALDARLALLQGDVDADRQTVEALERQARGLSGVEDPRTRARLEGLENARADALADIARTQADMRNLRGDREDLSASAGDALKVEVVSQTNASQSRSLAPVVALAVMLGLTGAVAVVLLRELLRRAR